MNEQLLMLISKQLEEIHIMLVKQESPKEPRGKVGRPTKKDVVIRYREKYPTGTKMECVKTMRISIKTVSKYWDLYEKMSKQTENIDS